MLLLLNTPFGYCTCCYILHKNTIPYPLVDHLEASTLSYPPPSKKKTSRSPWLQRFSDKGSGPGGWQGLAAEPAPGPHLQKPDPGGWVGGGRFQRLPDVWRGGPIRICVCMLQLIQRCVHLPAYVCACYSHIHVCTCYSRICATATVSTYPHTYVHATAATAATVA